VPQVKDKEGNLCRSVKDLMKQEPSIEAYEDLGVIQHRIGLLVGFLRDVNPDGTIEARIGGLTNTLRIKHRRLVNLPGVHSKYGEYIRCNLLPPKGHVMIGCDLSSLENTTRNNFVYDLDPDFVEAQSHPLYDPHLELAVEAGRLAVEDAAFYRVYKDSRKNKDKKWYSDYGELSELANKACTMAEEQADLSPQELFDELDQARHEAKTTNYSSMYGVGRHKLSKELGIPVSEAKKLIDAYWKKNWSVKRFASSCKVRKLGDQMWVKNPLNKYWYSLRSEEDIFSTVNQSAGDFIHTLWMHFIMLYGVNIRANFHDEVVVTCPEEDVDKVVGVLYEAINKVNEILQLKVPIKIDHQIGKNYGEVH
jgi:hypothetical protein